jgi:hypothetical protein
VTSPPADFDHDGKTDFAYWHPSDGTWHVIYSSTNTSPTPVQWGSQGDIPAVGDYDGDGKADYAVYRPSNGAYRIIYSSTGAHVPPTFRWRATMTATARPTWRQGTGSGAYWYIIPSSNPGSPIYNTWGAIGDTPVPAHYDGDGKADWGLWRPSTGYFYVILSSNGSWLYHQFAGATSSDIAILAHQGRFLVPLTSASSFRGALDSSPD